MKTKDQIISSAVEFFHNCESEYDYFVDEVGMTVVIKRRTWTKAAQDAIIGENDYYIITHLDGIHPHRELMLSIVIFYEE